MKVLLIGGAGFIGSHMVKLLGQQNSSVTTLDDLSAGHRDAVLTGDFVLGSCGDRHVLDSVLAKGFDAVMHFASFIQVGESVQHPDKYYQNNVVNTQRFLLSALAYYPFGRISLQYGRDTEIKNGFIETRRLAIRYTTEF